MPGRNQIVADVTAAAADVARSTPLCLCRNILSGDVSEVPFAFRTESLPIRPIVPVQPVPRVAVTRFAAHAFGRWNDRMVRCSRRHGQLAVCLMTRQTIGPLFVKLVGLAFKRSQLFVGDSQALKDGSRSFAKQCPISARMGIVQPDKVFVSPNFFFSNVRS